MGEKCFLYDHCSHSRCNEMFCIAKYKMSFFYSEAMIPEIYKNKIELYTDKDGTDLDSFTRLKRICDNISQFVEQHQHLFLHSSTCGNGKTSWAVKIIRSYLDYLWTSERWANADLSCKVLFVNVPQFLNSLKTNISGYDEYSEKIKNNITTADIVVFDDIAAKVGSEYEINQLLSIIENRTSQGKTCIYTSNLNQAEMAKALGERLASRICGLSVDIELNGCDKRGLSQLQ